MIPGTSLNEREREPSRSEQADLEIENAISRMNAACARDDLAGARAALSGLTERVDLLCEEHDRRRIIPRQVRAELERRAGNLSGAAASLEEVLEIQRMRLAERCAGASDLYAAMLNCAEVQAWAKNFPRAESLRNEVMESLQPEGASNAALELRCHYITAVAWISRGPITQLGIDTHEVLRLLAMSEGTSNFESACTEVGKIASLVSPARHYTSSAELWLGCASAWSRASTESAAAEMRQAYFEAAFDIERSGDYRWALNVYRELGNACRQLDDSEGVEIAEYHRAAAMAELGDFEDAEAILLERYVGSAPGTGVLWAVGLAKLYEEQGLGHASESILRKFLAESQGVPSSDLQMAVAVLAEVLLALGENGEAIEVIDTFLSRGPASNAPGVWLGFTEGASSPSGRGASLTEPDLRLLATRVVAAARISGAMGEGALQELYEEVRSAAVDTDDAGLKRGLSGAEVEVLAALGENERAREVLLRMHAVDEWREGGRYPFSRAMKLRRLAQFDEACGDLSQALERLEGARALLIQYNRKSTVAYAMTLIQFAELLPAHDPRREVIGREISLLSSRIARRGDGGGPVSLNA